MDRNVVARVRYASFALRASSDLFNDSHAAIMMSDTVLFDGVLHVRRSSWTPALKLTEDGRAQVDPVFE